jgi:two-component system OmpR family sensor kinase
VSLRARLLVGLVVLVAAGLAVAGVATYAAQRSFLYNRVDQQVVAAVRPIALELSGVGGVPPQGGQQSGAPGAPPAGATGPGGASSGGATGSTGATAGGGHRTAPPTGSGQLYFNHSGGLPDHDVPGHPGGGPGGPPAAAFAPTGTFAERLSPSGTVVGRPIVSAYSGETSGAYPFLPQHYPVTRSLAHPHVFTTSATDGSNLSYRTIAVADASGTTIVAVPLADVSQTLHRLLLVELLVAAGVLLALVVLGSIVIRIGLRPLDRMGRVAEEIAGGDLSRRVSPATPRTEVGRLGLALNRMLMTIERAFADRQASEERLRRFLSDASHELRTPLASIRGYAELFRLGASADPDDLELAMARIESEAARMGVLVEDLLMLARLDELPEKRTERVEPLALAERAVSDARATAPDRRIDLQGDAPAVAGDADQLHQALSNLLRNAVAHTPAGTPIEVRLRRDGDHVALSVRDHGPGLPDGVGDKVFDRFWRSDPGRSRGAGGAGLGLAIVQAIVQAHGGEVHADNAPDGGAVFRMLLPIAPDGAPAAALAPAAPARAG